MKKNAILLLILAVIPFAYLIAQPSVFFEIRNPRTLTHPTLGTADAYDLYMHTSYGGTFHSRGQIYLDYSTSRYAPGINGKGGLAFEHADLLAGELIFLGDTTPRYSTINVVDNSPRKVVFTWQSNFLSFLPNALVHNNVPDSATHIYTVYLKVANTAARMDVSFDFNLMKGQQFMITDVNNDRIPDELPYANGFLPVEMLSFQADKLGNEQVLLRWETAMELNNDKFVVERKTDRGEFAPIGEVKGAGTTEEIQHYTFTDRTGLGTQNYYRLRQVDIDGTFSYSDIVEIGFDAYANDLFVVYPSPATDHTFLKAISDLEGDHMVSVLDLSGNQVKKLVLSKHAPTDGMRIELADLADGMYLIRTVSPLGKAYINRIVKVGNR